ncbi:aldo/keto reductase [Aureibacillus halotolerans]|uniref:Diketogulonate reductase-like aldo/keto reductase n=1 Tax=Aureibacillus halotolerans TaxID=1508390 RepID=A0A4R6TVG9_9BACI|nr:aldo/keto reductase [Aureibacillus halotolerans]TDQ37196.1 diketogulonate reductase-like aldo/keto reductase [Aureibacillus halotolerans]
MGLELNQNVATLHNGVNMPRVGFGVWKITDKEEMDKAITAALDAGYRSFDTAKAYSNEAMVGQALKESNVPREEVFLTTKLFNDDHGYESTLKAFDLSLQRLDTDYLDLYLIHWPGKDRYVETWKAFEQLYRDKRVRAIGVCNFHPHHLETLQKEADIVPMVNQVELHPLLSQEDVRAYCKQHDIQIESYSPLARGKLIDHATLADIGKKHGKTAAQVTLRWHYQHDLIAIPKSVTPERIRANADIFNFELSEDDMAAIDAINANDRQLKNPDEFLF